MRVLATLILTVLFSLPALAEETNPVESAILSIWKAKRDDVLKRSALSERTIPATDDGLVFRCPIHKTPLLEFVLEKSARPASEGEPEVVTGQHRAYYCETGPEFFVRSEGEEVPEAWRGPVLDDTLPGPANHGGEPPPDVPDPPTPSNDAGLKEQVEKVLYRQMTDSGEQGFFENRYGELKDLGPGVTDVLFEIYDSTEDKQMKHLVVEALGELGDKPAAPRLMERARKSTNQGDQMNFAVALHRLGETSMVDRIVEESNKVLAQEGLPAADASGIHGQLGLLHSLIKKEDEALAHFQKAVELDPTNAIVHYNLACSYSKLARIDDALASIEKAVQAGYDDYEWMMVDGDLTEMRKDPRFKELLKKYQK